MSRRSDKYSGPNRSERRVREARPGEALPGEALPGEALQDEARLLRAAELVLGRELLTGPAPLPDFAALMSKRARRWRWLVGMGVTAAAGVAVALVLVGRTPISYVVAGAAAVSGTRIEVSANAPGAAAGARVRFSEGTEVTLRPHAALDVVARTAHGAVLSLDRGTARFSVTHLRGARWTVVAGPFGIEVTGTEFSVDWSPDDGKMVVDLAVGSVRVRGASVGGAVDLHAGERLIATVADQRVTLSPGGDLKPSENARSAGAPAVAPPSAAAAVSTGSEADQAPKEAGTGTATGVAAAARPSSRAAKELAAEAPAPVRVPVDGTVWASLNPSRSRRPSPTIVDSSVDQESREEPRGKDVAVWSPGAAGATEQLPEPPVPSLERSTLSPARSLPVEGPRLDPAPVAPPLAKPVPQSLTLGGGGLFCVTEPAQYSFEQAVAGLSVPTEYTLALANPRVDRSHSWCGESSVRLEASFDDSGRRNYFGRYPHETGQLVIRLDHPANLTGRTVTMHVFIEGPSDVRFSAELAAVNHGRWVSNRPVDGLSPGRWWTISHRFESMNVAGLPGSSNPLPFPNGGTSTVAATDRLALAIHSTGDRRAWRGAVFVDDVSWK